MVEGKQELRAKRMRLAGRLMWAGRILAIVLAAFTLFILIGEAFMEMDNGSSEEPVAGFLLGAIGAVGIAGAIVSFWRLRLAGIILVLVAAAMGIHIAAFAGRNHFIVWLMVGFPYLVAGGLLLYSWRLFRKTV